MAEKVKSIRLGEGEGKDSAAPERPRAGTEEPSLGAGDPESLVDLQPGQTVLELRAREGGAWLFEAAKKVGGGGRAIALADAVDVAERLKREAHRAGAGNLDVRLGVVERLPVEEGSVDWAGSSGALRLSPGGLAAFRELARVLKPGGRMSLVIEVPSGPARPGDAGAAPEVEYAAGLRQAGLREVRAVERTASDTGPSTVRIEATRPFPAALADQVEVAPAREGERGAVARLLAEADLPDHGIDAAKLWVARYDGAVVGAIAMERCGEDALVRSLVTAPAWRGRGLGRRLHDALVESARAGGVKRAFLLTRTIADLAATWGYRAIERGRVPSGIAETWEFKSDGCASALSMTREL